MSLFHLHHSIIDMADSVTTLKFQLTVTFQKKCFKAMFSEVDYVRAITFLFLNIILPRELVRIYFHSVKCAF